MNSTRPRAAGSSEVGTTAGIRDSLSGAGAGYMLVSRDARPAAGGPNVAASRGLPILLLVPRPPFHDGAQAVLQRERGLEAEQPFRLVGAAQPVGDENMLLGAVLRREARPL